LAVLEYVEGKMVCGDGLGEDTSRKYLRDIISGLMYLHAHVRFLFFPFTKKQFTLVLGEFCVKTVLVVPISSAL
jgi:hypothetical protein